MKYILFVFLCLSFSSRLNAQHQVEVRAQSFLVIFDTESKAVRIFPNNRLTSIRSEASKRPIYGPFLADSLYLYTPTDTILVDSIAYIQHIKPLLLLVGTVALIVAVPTAVQLVIFATYAELGIAAQVFFGVVPFIPPLTVLSFVYKKENLTAGKYIYGYQQFPFNYMLGFRR